MMKQMAERYKKEQQEEMKVIVEEKKYASKVKKPKDINKIGKKKGHHSKNTRHKDKSADQINPSSHNSGLLTIKQ